MVIVELGFSATKSNIGWPSVKTTLIFCPLAVNELTNTFELPEYRVVKFVPSALTSTVSKSDALFELSDEGQLLVVNVVVDGPARRETEKLTESKSWSFVVTFPLTEPYVVGEPEPAASMMVS